MPGGSASNSSASGVGWVDPPGLPREGAGSASRGSAQPPLPVVTSSGGYCSDSCF